ncbi:hypothetical protein RclHR1_00110027 [Rhizophagus clarus]|uniref:MARVEL domain-containing protein n=1 Tax=Rhizophagus clarus TaxID=94130 RepID=A0A2Z6QHV8_9GLOM|nr:hypothetical protein RclHR1_00110027 [Rhizophagus clarus]
MAINKCCCCIPLRAGVIIISIIWLLVGAYQTIRGIINLVSLPGTDGNGIFSVGLFQNLRAFIIITIVLYALVTIGAAFGLFVVICANKSRMLLIYSKIAYCIAAIQIISNILDIIAIALFNKEMEKICQEFSSFQSNNSCSTINKASLAYGIIITIIVAIFVIYFAIVISAYAHRKRENEDANKDNNPPYY